ncbi:MAG: energy transducer TonB [Pseudoxanthomonas sp.]
MGLPRRASLKLRGKREEIMKRILLGVLVLALWFPALAGGRGEVRKTIEASMLVTGSILVGAQGQVTEFSIDQPEKIERGVLELVNGNVRQWRFEPPVLEGKPTAMRNKMSVRIIGSKRETGDFAFRLGGVSFQPLEVEEGTRIGSKKLPPPRYPLDAARAGAGGTVYLIVKVGRDGSVQDVATEQVNLQYLANESIMKQTRKLFEDASLKAAKQWTFTTPVKGEDADEAFWTVRVPVSFAMGTEPPAAYGQWQAYVPGPRQKVSWDGLRDLPGFSPDTMVADGSVYQTGKGLRLQTPLQGG